MTAQIAAPAACNGDTTNALDGWQAILKIRKLAALDHRAGGLAGRLQRHHEGGIGREPGRRDPTGS